LILWLLGKFHKIAVPVLGEISLTTNILLEKIKKTNAINQKLEIKERWRMWRKEKKSREQDDNKKGLSSAFIFKTLEKYIPKNAIISVDVGNNTYSFGRYFECKEQTILMSGYLGSIGFGYPAAIGAYAANTKRPIVAITGDGGFGQYLAEVTTAVKYNMPIKHILLNNNELAKITKEQLGSELDVWKTSLHNPNFSKYANNCGSLGIRVSKKSELDKALKKLFEHKGPGMVEIMSDKTLI